MRPFDFYAPTTVVEALTLLDQYKDSVACIAGGTDLTAGAQRVEATAGCRYRSEEAQGA